MQLTCDQSVAATYKSPAQRARVISEHWFHRNIYCLACESDRLCREVPNSIARDFHCGNCGHHYELKTFRRRPRASLVDGAYSSLVDQINSGAAPTLCLLERNDFWCIRSLTAIHSSFLTPSVIEQRSPLGEHARRSGWIGCNIRLDLIPPDAEISVVANGTPNSKSETRRQFRKFLPLAQIRPERRGWTTLTLAIVRRIGKPVFSLADLYERNAEFSAVYPDNRNVSAKIRQQLQVLRDLGILAFEGKGLYRMLD